MSTVEFPASAAVLDAVTQAVQALHGADFNQDSIRNRWLSEAVPIKKCEPKICEVGGHGNILPLLGDNENRWPAGLRVVLYFLGLAWLFLGVAIVSDIFMGAIERITSKKRRIMNKDTGKYLTVKVWNDTVANLTLMALGSSAPEILLSVIELCGNNMYSGQLGPSTIVGSAAFNLLVITGVCIMAIPNGEVRFIKDTTVFAVTASFSVFAYVWLFIIVVVVTPDVVDIWEGVLTFLFFPMLIGLAFAADKGYLSSLADRSVTDHVTVSDMSQEDLAVAALKLRQQHKDASEEEITRMIADKYAEPTSRAAYRVQATRGMTGGKRVGGHEDPSDGKKYGEKSMSSVVPVDEELAKVQKETVFDFSSKSFAVLENAHTLNINVLRSGDLYYKASVSYSTREGTAKEGEDYMSAKGTLDFAPGEFSKHIQVQIIDDVAFEEDEDFFIDLSIPKSGHSGVVARLGDVSTTRVTIIDDDDPGVISFKDESMVISDGVESKVIQVVVKRSCGSNGVIKCKYITEDDNAIADYDYMKAEGVLTMEHGQLEAIIDITILPKGRYEVEEDFRMMLFEPSGGARFDETTDGGKEQCVLTITIKPDDDEKTKIDRMMSVLQMDWHRAQIGHSNWKDQFVDALFVNGGDEQAENSIMDFILHFLTIFWKLVFALIPPADFCGGWLCFCSSLAMIGLVTAFIGDLAGLLGCVLGVPDAITAITLVALGTSLPDTFASKTAAEQDPYADASIGNVTGSNSVNVFLGLGLPWMLGAIHWNMQGQTDEWVAAYSEYPGIVGGSSGKFIVIGGDLGYSVVIFSLCALVCIGMLVGRRKICGGELGGPYNLKVASAVICVSLWFLYITLSSIKSLSSKSSC